MLGAQRNDQVAIIRITKKGLSVDVKPICRIRAKICYDARDVCSAPHWGKDWFNIMMTGSFIKCALSRYGKDVGVRIEHRSEASRSRNKGFQNFDPFCGPRLGVREARHVCAGMGEAGHKPGSDGIANRDEDDRYGSRLMLKRARRRSFDLGQRKTHRTVAPWRDNAVHAKLERSHIPRLRQLNGLAGQDLRALELVDLRWDQIDFENATLAVRRAKKGSPSTHPIRGDELRALRRLQREQNPKSPFVFTSERGVPFTTAGFARMLERAGVAAELGFKAHPHMLRHACGFALANKGHDTRSLQAYLGHKNIQHTVRYTELSPDRFKDFWR
jgi:Phage integrase family